MTENQTRNVSQAQLDAAVLGIERHLERHVQRGRMTTADKQSAMGRISTGLTIDLVADSDLVIEAATEKEDLKKRILKDVVARIRPDALIATGTRRSRR